MSGDLDTEMQNKEDEEEGDENSDDENKDEEDNMETQAGTCCHLVIYFSYQNCAPSTCPTLR